MATPALDVGAPAGFPDAETVEASGNYFLRLEAREHWWCQHAAHSRVVMTVFDRVGHAEQGGEDDHEASGALDHRAGSAIGSPTLPGPWATGCCQRAKVSRMSVWTARSRRSRLADCSAH